jgi:uncharacterized lipoprotein YajG
MKRLLLVAMLMLAGCTTPRITVTETAAGWEARAPRAGTYALSVNGRI